MTMARKRMESEQAQEAQMEQARLVGDVVEAAPAQKPSEVVRVGGILGLFFSSQHDLEAWLANIERLEAERSAQVEAQAQAEGDIPN